MLLRSLWLQELQRMPSMTSLAIDLDMAKRSSCCTVCLNKLRQDVFHDVAKGLMQEANASAQGNTARAACLTKAMRLHAVW